MVRDSNEGRTEKHERSPWLRPAMLGSMKARPRAASADVTLASSRIHGAEYVQQANVQRVAFAYIQANVQRPIGCSDRRARPRLGLAVKHQTTRPALPRGAAVLQPPSGRTPSTPPTGRTPGAIARAHQAARRASTAMGHQQPPQPTSLSRLPKTPVGF